jgi:leucyl aminopeptidase
MLTYSRYFNRHYQSETGTEAAAWLFEKVKEVTSGNSAITVEQVEHEFNQPSIIARIPGNTDDLGKLRTARLLLTTLARS